MWGSEERVMAKMGRESVSMLLHAILLALFTLVFHHLIGGADWTQAALAAFLFTYPIRYFAAARLYLRPSFSWTGWMCADLLFFGVMGWKFGVMGPGGIVLAGLILMPASLFVSPMLMARFNAGVIFLYILLLNAQGRPLSLSDVWVSDILCLVLFAGAAMMVSVSRMRSHANRLTFREVATDVFEQLHLNLAVLDEQGRFILANRCALETLERRQGELAGILYADLISESLVQDAFPRAGAFSGTLTRLDGSLCPVAYELVPLTFRGGVFDSKDPDELFEYQLLVFTDISDLIEGQHALSRQKRNQTVSNMLEVFADGVKNPLAGISAYLQVLLRTEEKRSKGLESEQMKIYRQMVEDIEGLDSLLEDLMGDTRLTPEEVETRFANLKAQRQKDEAKEPENGPVPADS